MLAKFIMPTVFVGSKQPDRSARARAPPSAAAHSVAPAEPDTRRESEAASIDGGTIESPEASMESIPVCVYTVRTYAANDGSATDLGKTMYLHIEENGLLLINCDDKQDTNFLPLASMASYDTVTSLLYHVLRCMD